MFADLHLHSSYSDGSDTPAEVAARAVALGCAAFALTDHDTIAGVDEARDAAAAAGLGFLPAVEVSAQFAGGELHIVGMGIDIHNGALLASLDEVRNAREQRARRMVERLNTLGVPVEWDRVVEQTGGGVVGRMHIARAVHEVGAVRDVQAAFDKYIRRGRRAYIDRKRMSCTDAIDLIHGAGGLAFVGHPGIGSLDRKLPRLLALPFDGIEAYHSKHSPGKTAAFLQMAEERGLLVSGGSDCHGTAKRDPEMGKVRVPMECYERIKERLATR